MCLRGLEAGPMGFSLLGAVPGLQIASPHDPGPFMRADGYAISDVFFKFKIFRNDEEIVPQLCSFIYALPRTAHPALLNSAIQIFANLQDWLSVHPEFQGWEFFKFFCRLDFLYCL